MSRHRHVRNLRHDDYADAFSDDDPFADVDDDDDDDDGNGNGNGKQQHPTSPQPPSMTPQDSSLVSDLAAQFRICLGDHTLQEADIDAAIIAADYDVDAAMHLLRQQRAIAEEATRREARRLELSCPSPIGQMLQEEESRGERLRIPGAELPGEVRASSVPSVAVEGGMACVGVGVETVQAFRFDKPSPDDVVKAKQGGKGRMALRMPKASALTGGKRVVVAGGKEGENEGEKEKEKRRGKGEEEGGKAGAGGKVERGLRQAEGVQGGGSVAKVVKQRVKKVEYAKRVKGGCASVSIVVAGHVDAGKSTLLGHLLRLAAGGEGLDEGRGRRRRRKVEDLAWGTDEDGVERERGVTIDIATRVFERDGRAYAMIDAPGHRDFVPAMILGAAQASAALLVVDASPGEFEAGFSEDGQTREHALVLRSLGVGKVVVVVNKMDVAGYEEERYEEVVKAVSAFLRGNGWKMKDATFVGVSGREGVNLMEKPENGHPMMKWYKGESLMEAVKELRGTEASVVSEMARGPTRLVVSDFYKSASLGGAGAVTGRLLGGTIAPKDKLMICPGGVIATVKNVEIGHGTKSPIAVAGVDALPVSLGLMDLTDGIMIMPGNVLCDPEVPVPVVVRFSAQMVTVTTSTPLIQGTRAVLHIGGGAEAASISKLCQYVFGKRSAGSGGKKRRPRRLVKGETAIVEITCDRAVSMEMFGTVKALGRFALRQKGKTVAVGVVKEILATEKSTSENMSGEAGRAAS